MGLNLRFLYLPCRDLEAMRRFYGDLVGLRETYFEAGSDGGLAYACDQLQLTFFSAPDAEPNALGWHRQPGWAGGTVPAASWSIVADDAAAFRAAVERLTEAGGPAPRRASQLGGVLELPGAGPDGEHGRDHPARRGRGAVAPRWA
jgi:catechol 2,3-dioxygenase-like lactoylglutathione lyase family enzyme